jgi:hypothetical protein
MTVITDWDIQTRVHAALSRYEQPVSVTTLHSYSGGRLGSVPVAAVRTALAELVRIGWAVTEQRTEPVRYGSRIMKTWTYYSAVTRKRDPRQAVMPSPPLRAAVGRPCPPPEGDQNPLDGDGLDSAIGSRIGLAPFADEVSPGPQALVATQCGDGIAGFGPPLEGDSAGRSPTRGGDSAKPVARSKTFRKGPGP